MKFETSQVLKFAGEGGLSRHLRYSRFSICHLQTVDF